LKGISYDKTDVVVTVMFPATYSNPVVLGNTMLNTLISGGLILEAVLN
jgi:hypothetical protein